MFGGNAELAVWQAGAIFLKAVTYGASLAAAGGVFFLLIFATALRSDETRRITRSVCLLAGVGMVATLLRPLVTAGILGGGVASMADWQLVTLVLRRGEGHSFALRLFGLLLLLVALRQSALHQSALRLLALPGSLLASLSFALTGHASAAAMPPWPQLLLAAHMLAVAYWIGALMPLHFLARSAEAARAGAIAARFGKLALCAVGLLVAVGSLLLWVLVADPATFLRSDYGRLFALKLGLVAVLLGLAACNKLRLTPAILAGNPRAPGRLRRSIGLEIAAVCLILLVTAILTTVTGPPRG